MLLLNLLAKLWCFINHDRRPDWEKARERKFILAGNSLKTLSVTDRGGMSIDPEELRDQIVASREQLKGQKRLADHSEQRKMPRWSR